MKRILMFLITLTLSASMTACRQSISQEASSMQNRTHTDRGYVFETCGEWGADQASVMKALNLSENDIVQLEGQGFKYGEKLHIEELNLDADVIFAFGKMTASAAGGMFSHAPMQSLTASSKRLVKC